MLYVKKKRKRKKRSTTPVLSKETSQVWRRQDYDETVLLRTSRLSFPFQLYSMLVYGNLCIRDKNSLGKIVKVASTVRSLDHRWAAYNIQVSIADRTYLNYNRQVNKALSVCSDTAHPLKVQYDLLPPGLGFRAPRATKHCSYKYSFVVRISVSIDTLNAAVGRS